MSTFVRRCNAASINAHLSVDTVDTKMIKKRHVLYWLLSYHPSHPSHSPPLISFYYFPFIFPHSPPPPPPPPPLPGLLLLLPPLPPLINCPNLNLFPRHLPPPFQSSLPVDSLPLPTMLTLSTFFRLPSNYIRNLRYLYTCIIKA